jgi:hypothetical protein
MIQKKIFDNPSLYISTHVLLVTMGRLNVRFVIGILRSKWPISIRDCILIRRREFPRYSTRTTILRTLICRFEYLVYGGGVKMEGWIRGSEDYGGED